MKKTCIAIYGTTCAGKSTVGKLLSQEFGGQYVSFGDIKRRHISDRTSIGIEIENTLQNNLPIPVDLGYRVIHDHLIDGLNFVSGYPISVNEFSLFSKYNKIIGIMHLQADLPVLIERFFSRTECPKCHEPGISGNLCSIHGIAMVNRSDRSIGELEARKVLYQERILPFLTHISAKKIPCLTLDTTHIVVSEVTEVCRLWVRENKLDNWEEVYERGYNTTRVTN